jgi:hypothetical protein
LALETSTFAFEASRNPKPNRKPNKIQPKPSKPSLVEECLNNAKNNFKNGLIVRGKNFFEGQKEIFGWLGNPFRKNTFLSQDSGIGMMTADGYAMGMVSDLGYTIGYNIVSSCPKK